MVLLWKPKHTNTGSLYLYSILFLQISAHPSLCFILGSLQQLLYQRYLFYHLPKIAPFLILTPNNQHSLFLGPSFTFLHRIYHHYLRHCTFYLLFDHPRHNKSFIIISYFNRNTNLRMMKYIRKTDFRTRKTCFMKI